MALTASGVRLGDVFRVLAAGPFLLRSPWWLWLLRVTA